MVNGDDSMVGRNGEPTDKNQERPIRFQSPLTLKCVNPSA